MEHKTDLNIMDFSNIFQALASSQRTGTLKVENSDNERKFFYFNRGSIQLMALSEKDDIAALSFLKSGILSEDDVQNLILLQSNARKPIAQIALEANLIEETEILQALSFFIEEEFCDVFIWEEVHCEFFESKPPSNFSDFQFLSRPLSIHPNTLLMEAARRKDEWSRVKKHIPSTKDVFRVNQDSFHFFDESDPNTDYIREVLSLVDGKRDVAEITAQARMSKFDALMILKDLVESGEISALSGEELLKFALLCQKRGNIKKALRLYERAEKLGVHQYDLADRIGKSYEALGQTKKAINKYLDFAAKCCAQEKLDDAILTYQKVIRLDPNDISTHEQLIGLLLEQNRKEEAVREYRLLIQKYQKFDAKDKLMDAWKAVAQYSPGVNEEAYEELAKLYREIGDTVQAIIDLDELATNFLVEERFDESVAIFRKILTIDDECIDARLQLASTLSKTGRIDEAVQEYKKMAEMLSKSGVIRNSANWEFLITTYEKIVDLEPDNYLARKWLAEAYLEKKDREKSIMHLQDIIGIYRHRESLAQTIEPLSLLVQICPDQFHYFEELAQAYSATGQREKASETYARAARICTNNKKHLQAEEYFAEILKISPFELSAHREIANILKQQNLIEEAVEKYKDIARLCEGAGMYLEAISACEEIFRIVVDERSTLHMIARIYEKCEGRKGALEYYLKFAEKSLGQNNLGEAKDSLSKIQALDPQNPNIDKLDYDIQCRENLLMGSAMNLAPPAPFISQKKESTILFQSKVDPADAEKTRVTKKDGSRVIRPTITIKRKAVQDEPVQPSTRNLSGHLEKLKALKGGTSSSSPSRSPSSSGNEGKKGPSSVKNFADKLKALKMGGNPPKEEETQEKKEEKKARNKKMNAAIAKLKGLNKSDGD